MNLLGISRLALRWHPRGLTCQALSLLCSPSHEQLRVPVLVGGCPGSGRPGAEASAPGDGAQEGPEGGAEIGRRPPG